MCGRFVAAASVEEIAEFFAAVPPSEDIAPAYNIAPSSDVEVVVEEPGHERRIDVYRWGLVPVWAKDLGIGNKMSNARSETAGEKNSFKHSLARKRCIVPATGFYEWAAVPGRKTKQPYFIHRVDGAPLAFAGLWAQWKGQLDGKETVVRSCTILTTSANGTVRPLHDRMPVILEPDSFDRWLDPDLTDVSEISSLMVPAANDVVSLYPVSTEVNNARNKGAHLIDPVDLDDAEGSAGPQTSER